VSILDELKKKDAKSRLTEEVLYAEVLREVEGGVRRDGLWAKALSETDFDEAKAKSLYIKLRVQSLKDELTVARESGRQEEERIRQEDERQKQIRKNYETRQVPLETTKNDKSLTCNSCGHYGQMIWSRKVSPLGWLLIIFFGGFPLVMVANFLPHSLWFSGLSPLVAALLGYFLMYLLVSKYEVKCPKCKNRGIIVK
jgi:DNA-directed RNA polymerase subunit M/transcription elongation factor TFIIS